MAQQTAGRNNLLMAALIGLFSLVPFEWVAKGSLLVAVFLFIADPIPPTTRLLSLVTVVLVTILSKVHREWIAGQGDNSAEDGPSSSTSGGKSTGTLSGDNKTKRKSVQEIRRQAKEE
jgi:hypothetical protein